MKTNIAGLRRTYLNMNHRPTPQRIKHLQLQTGMALDDDGASSFSVDSAPFDKRVEDVRGQQARHREAIRALLIRRQCVDLREQEVAERQTTLDAWEKALQDRQTLVERAATQAAQLEARSLEAVRDHTAEAIVDLVGLYTKDCRRRRVWECLLGAAVIFVCAIVAADFYCLRLETTRP